MLDLVILMLNGALYELPLGLVTFTFGLQSLICRFYLGAKVLSQKYMLLQDVF